MSKSALINSPQFINRPISFGKDTESDNVCDVRLADSETALGLGGRKCDGCGRQFVPTGLQRFCDHSCYSESLRVPIELRFWAKVNKTPSCWLWTAATLRGYGQISLNRKPAYAHRLSWEMAYGPIPEGVEVLHKCDVPLCVRPDHLFLGSQQDNLADARQKGRLDETLPRAGVLTYEDRLAIFGAEGYRGICVDLARRYAVTKTCISTIRSGRFARRPVPSAQAAFDAVFERVPHFEVSVRGVLHTQEFLSVRIPSVTPELGERS